MRGGKGKSGKDGERVEEFVARSVPDGVLVFFSYTTLKQCTRYARREGKEREGGREEREKRL
jgi:hypothetical protein